MQMSISDALSVTLPGTRSAVLMTVKRHFTLALVLTFCKGPLQSATLERLSLADMITQSTAIVRAKVVDSYAAYSGRVIYTHYRLQVSESLKGSSPVGEVLIPGGVANDFRQTFAGAPQLQPGSEYVLFLWAGKAGLTQVIGLTQGLFVIPPGAGSDPTLTRAASHELMLERGSGRQVKDQTLVMKLSDLRSQIAGALGSAAK